MEEKRKRIQEENVLEENRLLQWHPAFYADLQIEFKEEEKKLKFEREGIYYVQGDIIPIQILVTSQLSPKKNLWLYSLTDKLRNRDATKELIEDYKIHKNSELYQSVMEVIVKANKDRIKEEKGEMCDALLELMKDELDEKMKEGENLGVNRMNQLILKLSELNRMEDIVKAASDSEYQKKLLEEFGI